MARKQKANKQTQGPGEDRSDRRREKESGKALVKKWPRIVLKSAVEIAANVKANALVVGVDALSDQDILKDVAKRTKVILVARNKMTFEQASEVAKNVLLIPNVKLTRMGQVKIALLVALSQGLIKIGDSVVCLSGQTDLGYMDTLMLLEIGQEFEIMATPESETFSDQIPSEVFDTLLNMAIELAHEGREGRPIGTTFVLGDHENVLKYSRPLVMNPLQGHPEEERNILDSKFKETIKEFSSIDGAFLIKNDGIVTAAGRHLNAAYLGEELPQGLGSRHAAAAAITGVTDAAAITISESTGTVTIFKAGKILMDIEKPPR